LAFLFRILSTKNDKRLLKRKAGTGKGKVMSIALP